MCGCARVLGGQVLYSGLFSKVKTKERDGESSREQGVERLGEGESSAK